MQSHTSRTVYFLMAAWLLVGSVLRILWLLGRGFGIDALPVISITIALLALALAFRPVRATRTDP